MQEVILNWLPLSLSLAALLALFVLLSALLSTRKKQQEMLVLLEKVSKKSTGSESEAKLLGVDQELKRLKKTLVEILSRQQTQQLNMKKQMRNIEHVYQGLEQQILEQYQAIQEVADQGTESKYYQRAARLVQQGASIQEVVESCELPYAEAELIYNLYNNEQSEEQGEEL